MRRALLLLVMLLGTGCVYYNGMYNTKRFAGRARKAEREGRTFDAASNWGQVSVRAESLLVRHPRSKYAEEARLLYGIARARLNDCAGAVPDLEQVMLASRKTEFAEEAAEIVGSCKVLLGDPASAAVAYGRITGSQNEKRRDLALYAHGQALRLSMDYEAAYSELAGSEHPRAQGERAAALAGMGRIEDAEKVVDSLVAVGDTLAPWPDIVALVGRADVEAGHQLTNRLVELPMMSMALRGRLLIDDGLRLAEIDEARGERQLEVASSVKNSERAVEARLIVMRRRVRETERIDSLREIAADLRELEAGAGSFTQVVLRLAELTARAALAADSVAPGAPEGDLRLFLAAEIARDSINAPLFAALQFERIVAEWPGSPFAPKALLAMIVLEPAHGDSLRQQMRTAYPASPYLMLIDGADSPQLAALEDSLGRFVGGFRGTTSAPGAATPTRPGSTPNRPRTLEPQ